jgi:hypothetical protein
MDEPADPAAPLEEVYQAFFDVLAKEGTEPSTNRTLPRCDCPAGPPFRRVVGRI